MSSKKKPDVLTQDNTTPDMMSAWERWQLPNMDADIPIKKNAYDIPAHAKAKTATEKEAEESLKPLTAEDLEKIQQAAYDDGFAQGKEAGHQAGYDNGYKSGASDIKAAITKLSQISHALLDPIPEQDKELEQTLLQLVDNICKRVVHRELMLDSSGIVPIVREAIDALSPGAKRLRIHLNAADMAFVEEQLKDVGEWEDHWRIVAHPNISPGGCIIETDASMVDARAEKRLSSVIQQVYEQRKHALEEKGQQHGNVDQLMDEVESFAADDADDIELELPVSDVTEHTEEPSDDGSEPAP